MVGTEGDRMMSESMRSGVKGTSQIERKHRFRDEEVLLFNVVMELHQQQKTYILVTGEDSRADETWVTARCSPWRGRR